MTTAYRIALTLVMTLTLGLAGPAQADELWQKKLDEAKKLAKKEGKDLFIEFTGSDWCPPCKAFYAQVASKSIFKDEIPKYFVLVKLDNQRNPDQPAEEKAEYKKWAKHYSVRGVPTVLLADHDGRPYVQKVGFGGQSAEEYVAMTVAAREKLIARDEAMAKAAKAEGVAKAKLLDEALSSLDGEVVLGFYTDEIEQIAKLDAKNEAGLKDKYETMKQLPEIKKQLRSVMMSYRRVGAEKSMEAVQKLKKDLNPTGQALQEVLFVEGLLLMQGGKQQEAVQLWQKAEKAAPGTQTGKRISSILKRMQVLPEAN